MADFVVTSLDDSSSDDLVLTLREAVELANAQAGADSITFDPGLSGVLRLTQGALAISDDVTIDGAGQITITGDANGDDALDAGGLTDSEINANACDNTNTVLLSGGVGAVELTGLTLTGGGISGAGNLTIAGSTLAGSHTGAVSITGALTLLDSQVRDNTSSLDGEATYTSIAVQYEGDGIADPHGIYAQLDDVKYQYGCFFASFLRDGTATVPAPAELGVPCP